MRRLLNHTHVSQKKKTKKKRRKKKKRKKLDPENAERVPNEQQFQKPRHEKEALPSGAPHAGGASSVSLQSRCDSPQAASFLGASAGQWNHGTGRPKSRFVFPWVSPHVYGEGAMEKKVWRVGPICAMENLGMVGGFVTPIRASASVNHT